MNSDEDSAALMAAFKKRTLPESMPNPAPMQPAKQPSEAASSSPAVSSSQNESVIPVHKSPVRRRLQCVRIPPVRINRAEYTYYEPSDEVERIVREISGKQGEIAYQVKLSGNGVEQVSLMSIENRSLTGKGGRNAFHNT